jgi:hypothetical protein
MYLFQGLYQIKGNITIYKHKKLRQQYHSFTTKMYLFTTTTTTTTLIILLCQNSNIFSLILPVALGPGVN